MDRPTLRERIRELPQELVERIREQGDIPRWLMRQSMEGPQGARQIALVYGDAEFFSILSAWDLKDKVLCMGEWRKEREEKLLGWLLVHGRVGGRLTTKTLDSFLLLTPDIPWYPNGSARLVSLLTCYYYLVAGGWVEPSEDQVAALLRLTVGAIDKDLGYCVTESLQPIIYDVLTPLVRDDENFFTSFLRRFPEHQLPSILALLGQTIESAGYPFTWPDGEFRVGPWTKVGLTRKQWSKMSRGDVRYFEDAWVRAHGEPDSSELDKEVSRQNQLSYEGFPARKLLLLQSLARATIPLLYLVHPASREADFITGYIFEALADASLLGADPTLCEFIREFDKSRGENHPKGALTRLCALPSEL